MYQKYFNVQKYRYMAQDGSIRVTPAGYMYFKFLILLSLSFIETLTKSA